MKPSQLLITSNLNGQILADMSPDAVNGHKLEILTIGFTGATYLKRNEGILSKIELPFKMIDLSDIHEEIQENTRQFCLDFKYEFPRKPLFRGSNLFDLFNQKDHNLWWFTGLSEMGSFRTPFVEDIYSLSIIQKVLEHGYEHIIIDIIDEPLRNVIVKYVKNKGVSIIISNQAPVKLKSRLKQKFLMWWILSLLVFISNQIAKLIGFRTFQIGHKLDNSEKALLFFSFFPSLWSKQVDGSFSNKIFSVILPEIQTKYPAHDLIFTVGYKQFLSTILPQRNIFKKQGVVFLENYLRIRDILFLLSPRYIKIILKYRFQFRPEITEAYSGFDISPLVRKAMNISLFDPEFFRDTMIFRGINNLLIGNSVLGLVHPSEFQCYEKAIWFAAIDRTKTYAFQHSAIGKNWLNYYFNNTEIRHAASAHDDDAIPLPDIFITAGKYPQQVMLENQYPVEKLFLCGAIRYDHLAKYLAAQDSKSVLRNKYHIPEIENVLIILTGVNENESYDMVRSLFDALQCVTTRYRILYKAHPLRVLDEKIKALHTESGIESPLQILPVQANYFDYISLADITLFCNSTIGVESIALGTPAISYDNYHSMSSYNIIEVGNAVFHVDNADGLSLALDSIMGQDNQLKEVKKLWPKAIEDTFYQLDGMSNKRFLKIINQIVIEGQK
jgi:surface carbohydrate biosynthesis protein (TIGR04326 family)